MNPVALEKASTSNSFYSQPSTSGQSISTISDRISMGSERSYCSGVVINGQVRCCQRALDVAGKSTSQMSISSGVSFSSDLTSTLERKTEILPKISLDLSQNVVERELKMANPKTIQGMKEQEESLDEIVTKL